MTTPETTPETASEEDSTGTQFDRETAFALIRTDGMLEWKPLADEGAVRLHVSGSFDSGTVVSREIGLTRDAALEVLASDIGAYHPDEFTLNPLAERVITALSDGSVTQPWHGDVAVCEYDRDPNNGEIGFPQAMSKQRIAQITALCDGS